MQIYNQVFQLESSLVSSSIFGKGNYNFYKKQEFKTGLESSYVFQHIYMNISIFLYFKNILGV